MTLLSIAQDAADEIGIYRPGAVASSTDPDAQKLYRLANKVGYGLMRVNAWQILTKEQTFTALGQEVQTSILPSDFDRFIPEAFWDRSNSRLVSGPITEVQWQSLKAAEYTNSTLRRFIYRGGQVSVIPAFAGGESLAFAYVSKNWAASSGGTEQSKFLADTDTTVFDEDLFTAGLIYEYLKGEGLPWEMARAEYMEQFDRLIANDQPSANVMVAADIFSTGSRHFDGVPSAYTDGLTSV
jgi:hypothetical protein